MGCDDNPVARYMFQQYGLHQFTNSGTEIGLLDADDGLVLWTRENLWLYVTNLRDNRLHELPRDQLPEGSAGYPAHISAGRVLFVLESYENDTTTFRLFLWSVQDNRTRQVPIDDAVPTSFDGSWAVVAASRAQRQWVVNVDTGERHLMADPDPNAPWRPSTTVVGGGWAYTLWAMAEETSFLQPTLYHRVDELRLDTGENRTIWGPTAGFEALLEGGGAVALVTQDGVRRWMQVREGELWSEPAQWDHIQAYPALHGAWAVGKEAHPGNEGVAIIAHHAFTQTRYTLTEVPGLMWWNPIKTDGGYVILQTRGRSGPAPTDVGGYENLYWIRIPDNP